MSNACVDAPTDLRGSLRGRVGLAALAFTLALGGVLAWIWVAADSRPAGRSVPGPESPSPTEVERPAPGPAQRSEAGAPRGEAPSREPELEAFRSTPQGDPRLIGKTGSIRGRIEVTGEDPFPNHWRLVVRPSHTLAHRESAVERSLEFLDGRQEFELGPLPLGGYDVHGEAEGFNGQLLPVPLEPGNEHPWISLRLVPAGVLEGKILDPGGLGASGIPITLFEVTSGEAREAMTDATGTYRFPALQDGSYELLIGRETAPLIPERRPLRFQAPRLTFPDIELPVLGKLRVRVVDSLERPLEGIEIIGSGTNGGIVEGTTDYNGTLLAEHLPAGRYRLRLSHAGIGEQYTRRVAVDVVVGETAEAPVRFGP